MTTGYTQAELDEMERAMWARAPTFPSLGDLKKAHRAEAVTMAGSNTGLLVHLESKRGKRVMLFFNPVLALRLQMNINLSATTGEWWKTPLEYQRSETLRIPTSDDAKTAKNVKSLATAALGPGMLVIPEELRRHPETQMENEMNPLHWKREHQLAGVIACFLGAFAGIAYSFYCWQMLEIGGGDASGMIPAWRILPYLTRPSGYLAWAVIGAVTAALIFYMTRLLKAERDAH